MKIYKLRSGILAEDKGQYYNVPATDWNELINDDAVFQKLAGLIGSGKATATSDLNEDEILAPVDKQELWACGVTYLRSKVGRQEESKATGGADFYAKVYEAERPEVFFKSTPHRVVGHKAKVNIRKDSTWDVPEPELTLAVTSSGKIIGYTIGNDMSSRSIEGENPLYLPQAKTYDGCAAIGPCIYITDKPLDSKTTIQLVIGRNNTTVFEDRIAISQMKRTVEELVSFVYRECSFPHGSLVMTGTGIVPGSDFTLKSGDEIKISIDHIGVLINTREITMTFLIILFAIALQVFLTIKKISPFLSLLIVAIIAGLCLGMSPAAILVSVEKGVGSTLGGLALILCLGAILGKILEAGGAAEKISSTLINGFGEKNIQWAVLLTGFFVGIPLYYNAGFVILVPLVFSIARRTGLSLLYIAIPMAASLSATHCFLPPHPGPVVLVNAFNADTGKTLLYGLMITIPVVIIAGPLLGRALQRIKVNTNTLFAVKDDVMHKNSPAAFPSFFIALLPVLLITLSVLATNFLADGTILKKILLFTGDSTIALLVAVLLAIWYFSLRAGESMETAMKWVSDAVSGIAMILLIITAGGVFKQVLTDSGTAAYIASFSSHWQMPPLVFAWIVTALLRVTIGSATVAGITAAGVVAPLVATGAVSPELMVLAVGTGSVFGSHINDTGFWMFKEFFKLSLKQTFLSWTLMETIISILGLAGVLLLDVFI